MIHKQYYNVHVTCIMSVGYAKYTLPSHLHHVLPRQRQWAGPLQVKYQHLGGLRNQAHVGYLRNVQLCSTQRWGKQPSLNM